MTTDMMNFRDFVEKAPDADLQLHQPFGRKSHFGVVSRKWWKLAGGVISG